MNIIRSKIRYFFGMVALEQIPLDLHIPLSIDLISAIKPMSL